MEISLTMLSSIGAADRWRRITAGTGDGELIGQTLAGRCVLLSSRRRCLPIENLSHTNGRSTWACYLERQEIQPNKRKFSQKKLYNIVREKCCSTE
mgnify:CR=1 FL=1